MTSVNLKLNNGKTIPALGLGTWRSGPGEVEKAVEHALTVAGYRHVDAAFAYGNEGEVGTGIANAIKTGKVTRDDIFVTTKVITTYWNKVAEGYKESLEKLGLEKVDLLLMHWPVGLNPKGNHPTVPTKPDGTRDHDPEFDVIKSWRQYEQLYKDGKVGSIGVCNCSVPMLTRLLAEAEIPPAINQIESHPLLPQDDVTAFCKEKGIIVEAYSPFGSIGGPVLQSPTVLELAKKYNVTPSVILVSFHISEGRVVLPKSVTLSRIEANAKVVELSEEDLHKLDTLHKTEGITRFCAPPWGIDLGFPDWMPALK
jgi:glycerol 2-dehydrogenase (NADP+)